MEQTPFDLPPHLEEPTPIAKPASKSKKGLWIALAIAVLCAVAGGYYGMQVRAEQARLEALRNQVKAVVLADNALALEILDIDESNHITYAELFKRTEKNKEERDNLIRQLRAIEAGPYQEDAQKFVRLIEIESDFVRAEEAVYRQNMEAESRSDALKEASDTADKAVEESKDAGSRYMAAPYGEDFDEKLDLGMAKSKLTQTTNEYATAIKAKQKAVEELKTKVSDAKMAADDWLEAEPSNYPKFAPSRDVTRLLIKWKTKYKFQSDGEAEAKTVKPIKANQALETPATAPTPKSTAPKPTPTPSSSSPTRIKSTSALIGERFPETRLRVIDSSEIAQLSDDAIRYAINEMYARYGMTFKEKDLQADFAPYSWYRPNDRWKPSQIEGTFTKTERANMKTLTQERSYRAKGY